jgi:hypothetical protein
MQKRRNGVQATDATQQRIDQEGLRAWLRDLRAAQSAIEREGAEALRKLTPEESLRIYRALWERSHHLFDYTQPSPLVQRVQKVFRRYLEAKQRESLQGDSQT